MSSCLRPMLLVLAAASACGGDDGNGNAWEATGEESTTSTTTTTSGSTTDPSTTGTSSTTDPTVSGTDSTGTTGEPELPDPLFHSIAGGEFGPVGAMAPPVAGRAQLLRALTGLSSIEVAVEGLAAATAYNIGLHRQPCALQDGGGYYLVDPSAADNNANRLRTPLTTDADGLARGTFTFDHFVRRDGMSIVVRDPMDDSKIGCADLRLDALDPIEYEGSLASFAAADTGDESITGEVTLDVESGGSTLIAQVTGMTESVDYDTAVHLLPCAANNAGAEYERDPAGPAEAGNQLRLELVPDVMGSASDMLVVSDHEARPDAQSLVIRRVVTAMMMTTRPKVACADLVRTSWPDVLTTLGDVQTLQLGTDRGFDIGGSATMIRQDVGWTAIEVTLSGLSPSQTHPVLVHDRPCAAGGSPYAINPGVDEMLQSNEMWMLAVADETGAAEVSDDYDHLARAEAMSVVVADPDDGAVLACADLTRP